MYGPIAEEGIPKEVKAARKAAKNVAIEEIKKEKTLEAILNRKVANPRGWTTKKEAEEEWEDVLASLELLRRAARGKKAIKPPNKPAAEKKPENTDTEAHKARASPTPSETSSSGSSSDSSSN